MFPRRFSLALLASLSLATLAPADILVLKDGKRLEGNVLNESPDVIRMRYRLTEKIWDEKDFPRADIAELIRQTPSEVDFKEGKYNELLPTKDMMTADEYERLIQDKLRPFVNKHPGTPQASEVEKIVSELQAEKEKVVSGQLKVEGKWLSPDEVKRDDYNIRAYKLRNEIKSIAASNKWEDWVLSLRTYDRFIDPGTGFFASTHYPLLIGEIQEVLAKYENELLRMIREQPILLKNQEEGTKKLLEPDKSRTEAKIKSDLDEWKIKYDAEKRARIRWLIPYKLDASSLNEAHKAVVNERSKLSLIDLESLTKQNELLVAVFRYLADENAVEAEAALENAVKAANNNRDYSRIFADLRGKVTSLKNEIQRKKNAQRTFNQSAGAIGGASGPIMDDRVAKALEEAQTPKQPAAAEEPASPAAKAPAATPAAPVPAPAPAPRPAPVVEEESSFITYVVIGGVVLLAVLLTAMFMQKKKKED